jgi:2-methylcitrate dehydratase PrpD
VEVVHDPAITAQGSNFRHKVRVEVHLRDGSVHTETREAPHGSEQSFASEADIVDKFRKLTRAVLPPKQQDQLVDATLRLEQLGDARRLIELLRVG